MREKSGIFSSSEAVRVFHGPGEGSGALRSVAIDRFGEHYWVTEWEKTIALPEIRDFLQSRGARTAVHVLRPLKGVPADAEAFLGEPPEGRLTVREGSAAFRIQLLKTKHPGLFLDHAPLREWLLANARDLSILNTFSYTGSLSVAAGLGGASQVTTLDLSKPVLEWAKENWETNRLDSRKAEFIFGDYFDWLQRLEKKKRLFDCVIVDPPSFSRTKQGSFSTAKDLERLHEAAFGVLAPGGILVTSINSANVTRKKYFYDIHSAAKTRSRKLDILREIELPPTFPVKTAEDRYLKGWILKCG